jgi:3-carboxy-cis,cis-muconate cycloisomerase
MGTIFESFVGSAACDAHFSASGFVGAMLKFEAALAQAQAQYGEIAQDAALAIIRVCEQALEEGWIDAQAIAKASSTSGSVAIPLVAMLKETLAQQYPSAVAYAHRGATSQDVIDTALVLSIKAMVQLIVNDIGQCVASLRSHASRQLTTPILARTLMQPASVTSVGMKCAQWLLPLERSLASLTHIAPQALVIQLAGAVGTRAQLGPQADKIAALMANQLGLGTASNWHTQRDHLGRLAAELALISGALAKIADDVLLMSQFELGELAEPHQAGRGASTAMPHKQNPVASIVAQAAHLQVAGIMSTLSLAMVHPLERAAGQWQAELLAWPRLLAAVHASSFAMAAMLPGLVFNRERMAENIGAVARQVDEQTAQQWFDPQLAQAAGREAAKILSVGNAE